MDSSIENNLQPVEYTSETKNVEEHESVIEEFELPSSNDLLDVGEPRVVIS